MSLLRIQSGRWQHFLLFLIAGLANLVSIQSSCAEKPPTSNPLLTKIEQEHGGYARERVAIWEKLIANNRNVDNLRKLIIVNDFFNKMAFSNDIDLWGKEDYWATPLQMLTSNILPCERWASRQKACGSLMSRH